MSSRRRNTLAVEMGLDIPAIMNDNNNKTPQLNKEKSLELTVQDLPSTKDILAQGNAFCSHYIYCRLKKQNLLSPKLEDILKADTSQSPGVCQEILKIGNHLESMYPNIYQDISRQINMIFTSADKVRKSFDIITDYSFDNGQVTWGKIISTFAVAGALAVDCVQQGHQDYVQDIIESFDKASSKLFALWIFKEGGWKTLLTAFPVSREHLVLWFLTGLGSLVGFLFTFIVIRITD